MSRFNSFTWIVSILVLDSAIAQVAEVTGFIGDSVLMQCFSPSPDVNVYWRDKDDKVLLDIIDGVHDPTTQHHKFRGRVLSPPDQNQRGNFSIVLQKLQKDDTGAYDCDIPSEGVEKSYRLQVKAIAQVAEVTGFIGDSVLMPCLSPSPDVNVYWRDKDDKVLLDVVGGVHVLDMQNPRFRGRVLSPPDQNQKGNFSIVLQKLQEDDAGAYDCNIPSEGVEKSYRLVVAAKPVPASTPAPLASPHSSSPPPAGNAALSLALPLLLLLGSAWQR